MIADLSADTAGSQGAPGEKGDPGLECSASPDYLTGILLVRHSQTSSVPRCEPGHIRLWDGYSLLYIEGNEKAHHQDLGFAGSCVKRFSTMPFMFCDMNNVCNYASRNDKSYWLSTNAPIPMMPVSNTAIREYISRCVVCEACRQCVVCETCRQCVVYEACQQCVVCEAPSNVMAGGGQSLSSPGSCLEDFRARPSIECSGARGSCHYFANKFSFWLATIDDDEQFGRPRSATLKVCIRGA
ncbi:collagen alpha-2(IV) chain-like [Pollicipes pollicipes]|uniref:collagen alpha-2(IV) chain-like n=1 Tax=Pollicipes pollicipes TaxID=41117 RepID=UPI001884B12A|nr:collagen alpha-2(IV) chain-like [Pollicipes pollicipes]